MIIKRKGWRAGVNNAELHGCHYKGWQCFHCGECFETVGGARDHFGADPQALPGCMIKVEAGNERGWLMRIRALEKRLAEYMEDLHRS